MDEYLSANLTEQWEKKWNKSDFPEEIGAWVSEAKLISAENQLSLSSSFGVEFKVNFEEEKEVSYKPSFV